jgi:hypothetical protein
VLLLVLLTKKSDLIQIIVGVKIMVLVNTFIIVIGLYVSCMNWLIFINNDILKNKSSSYGLFIGGILLYIGISNLPDPYNQYPYLGFLIDFGCIPWLLVGLGFKIIKYCRE